VARLEQAQPGPRTYLSLGLPELNRHLPGPGLARGVLNEIAPAAYGDHPAAFGFAAALLTCALDAGQGRAVLVASRRALAEFGAPYGHGLVQLGLDVGRLLLVETGSDKDALWALEEALRAPAELVMVVGALEASPGLTASRRLNLAAAARASPLVLLRRPSDTGASAAATRWRIAAAPAAHDRFGALAEPRWHVALERCRNGRPGEWLIEWDHVAHRFRLAERMADRTPRVRAGAGLRHAG
jgi:protein ImuA